jgi:hypothetical protein
LGVFNSLVHILQWGLFRVRKAFEELI